MGTDACRLLLKGTLQVRRRGGGDSDFESPLLSGYLDLWRGKRDWAHFCPVYFLLGGCRWVGGEGGGLEGEV